VTSEVAVIRQVAYRYRSDAALIKAVLDRSLAQLALIALSPLC
jgi:hypothetical protein